jgi:hypothetical protein
MGATRGEFCNASLRVFLLLLIVVIASVARTGNGVRAFAVRMPSGERYWTVIDEALEVVPRGACQARRDRPTPATITPGYSNAEAQVAISNMAGWLRGDCESGSAPIIHSGATYHQPRDRRIMGTRLRPPEQSVDHSALSVGHHAKYRYAYIRCGRPLPPDRPHRGRISYPRARADL